MKKDLFNLATKFFFYTGSAAYVLLIGALFASVISRYCLGRAFSWSEEVYSFLFLWVSYIGIILAMENDSHLRVDTVLIYMKARTRRMFDILNLLVIIGFSMVLCWLGVELVLETMDMEQYAVTVPVPIALVSTGIPISFLAMGCYALRNLAKLLKTPLEKKE